MSSVSTTPEVLHMHVNDVGWKGFDFDPILPAGESLTGTPTISISPSSGLAAASVGVTASAFYDADPEIDPIAIGSGVIAKFTATVAAKYTVTVTCGTTNGQTLSVTLIIDVGPR